MSVRSVKGHNLCTLIFGIRIASILIIFWYLEIVSMDDDIYMICARPKQDFIKIRLYVNNGDWRPQTSILLKLPTKTTFGQFKIECAKKCYSSVGAEPTNIRLYQPCTLQPLEDENNTVLSELVERNELSLSNSHLIVVLSKDPNEIIYPSESQRNDMDKLANLTNYLSVYAPPCAQVDTSPAVSQNAKQENNKPKRNEEDTKVRKVAESHVPSINSKQSLQKETINKTNTNELAKNIQTLQFSSVTARATSLPTDLPLNTNANANATKDMITHTSISTNANTNGNSNPNSQSSDMSIYASLTMTMPTLATSAGKHTQPNTNLSAMTTHEPEEIGKATKRKWQFEPNQTSTKSKKRKVLSPKLSSKNSGSSNSLLPAPLKR
ncbi:hypothetical protein RFI_08086 [Reticulomyxa filosa]|uniref:Uncharacterized protein n=1 Tax=Reticulomyxa filosa TaxID=46433 RepID=X6NTG1_RETFI|nr:hypothetical protein RFI_08086 [Reticulomyxa filosa]|eukprot:ETO29039.1 hypothetical protein RFI_08086 [Reticulomyxa filosa]